MSSAGADNLLVQSNGDSDASHAPGGIIDRGRGPEIIGTRITVYRIMDFLRYEYKPSEIAEELGLSESQVLSAIEYIRARQSQVDLDYNEILRHVQQRNPPEVEQGRAKTREELRERIMARRGRKGADDHPVGQ
jgi:uncharacterized protein (DUF433 family)